MPRPSIERVIDRPVEGVFARYCGHVGSNEWACASCGAAELGRPDSEA